jgi:hypothetical protein
LGARRLEHFPIARNQPPSWPGHSRPKNGVASLAYGRLKDGVASLAYVPAVHDFATLAPVLKTWMPGTRPGMTSGKQ